MTDHYSMYQYPISGDSDCGHNRAWSIIVTAEWFDAGRSSAAIEQVLR